MMSSMIRAYNLQNNRPKSILLYKNTETGLFSFSDMETEVNEKLVPLEKLSLDLIENTASSYTLAGITGSRNYYEGLLDGIINNFDHYERHLYFRSGSTSWPKSNTLKPFINQLSTTSESETWYTAELQDAILYDAQNQDLLTNTVPSFIKEDQDNRPYEIFIHMIAQHFDNLWIYTDAVSKKYDADNRLERGVSKDLIEDLLKNFYSNNF